MLNLLVGQLIASLQGGIDGSIQGVGSTSRYLVLMRGTRDTVLCKESRERRYSAVLAP